MRVIVGIDGSEAALAAVRVAAVEASRRRVPLHVVHAFVWSLLPVGVGPVADDLPGTGLEQHALDLLREAEEQAREAAPGLVVRTALIDGAATPVLLAEAEKADLLVVGDRGLGGFSGLIVGSVAVHAAAHAACPVLVVRGKATAAGDNSERPVVVGVDGSEASSLAVGFAFEECALRGAPLVALLAWRESDPAGAHEWRSAATRPELFEAEARRTVSEALAGWRGLWPDVEARTEIVRGNPKKALVEWSGKAQLVVVGARGRDTFKGLVLGSVSQSLLYHSACPVAVVRSTTEEGER